MLARSRLPARLQHELKRSPSVWGWRLRNIVIPAAVTVAAWLWLVWLFGGFK